jgi:hypothetical protein
VYFVGEQNPLEPLIDFLEKEYQSAVEGYERMLKEGVLSFEGLQYFFTPGKLSHMLFVIELMMLLGKKVVGFVSNKKLALEVARTKYK